MCQSNPPPNGANSVFYIDLKPYNSHLDGVNVVFGQVVRGLSVLRGIEAWNANPNPAAAVSPFVAVRGLRGRRARRGECFTMPSTHSTRSGPSMMS